MADNTLQIAVIGAGHMGNYHARAVTERADARLAAVCDIDADRAAKVAGDSGAEVVTSIDDLPSGLDGAVIAAATSAHADLALGLIDAGVPLLVEKPLAATAEEAHRIADAAESAGVLVQVGHLLRFDPVTRAVAALDIVPRYTDVTWVAPFTARSLDVGVVMDLVIHGLDLVLYWMQTDPEQVDAFGGVIVGPHEDLVSVRLRFPGGWVANLTASRFSRSRERTVRLFAENMYVKLDYGGRTAEVVQPKEGLSELDVLEGMSTEDLVRDDVLEVEEEPDALRAQLDAFLRGIRGEKRTGCSADEGARAVEVAQTIVRQVHGD